MLSFAIISVDDFSIGTNFSAVASCFNNIGPGFELVGATQNFSIYSDLSKIILSLDMLLADSRFSLSCSSSAPTPGAAEDNFLQ